MVRLVRDDPEAAREDLVLEVDRVEDARTVRQRLRIPAAEWREFVRTAVPDATPRTVKQAYRARQEFWDWLADEQAGVPPEGPSTGSHEQPVAPSAAWLSARYRDWQDRPDGAWAPPDRSRAQRPSQSQSRNRSATTNG